MTTEQGGSTTEKRRPRLLVRVLLALLIGLAVGVVVVLVTTMLQGEAGDPGDLAERFPEAGVTCVDFGKMGDTRQQKALSCGTDSGQSILITTYADTPSREATIDAICASPPNQRRYAYVIGDDFDIVVRNRAVSAGPPERVAQRLAQVLGGEASTFACP